MGGIQAAAKPPYVVPISCRPRMFSSRLLKCIRSLRMHEPCYASDDLNTDTSIFLSITRTEHCVGLGPEQRKHCVGLGLEQTNTAKGSARSRRTLRRARPGADEHCAEHPPGFDMGYSHKRPAPIEKGSINRRTRIRTKGNGMRPFP